jgi:hypothetical protein
MGTAMKSMKSIKSREDTRVPFFSFRDDGGSEDFLRTVTYVHKSTHGSVRRRTPNMPQILTMIAER